MAYDKQNFKSGQKLMAAQLNAMDNAIGNNDSSMDNVALQITAMNEKINKQNLEKIDGAYVENGYLFLTSNGEIVIGNLGPFSGGSGTGGSSENKARLTVKNVSGWLSKTIAESQDYIVAIDWSSKEDGLSTFNTSSLRNCSSMFYQSAVKNINISSWDTSKITTMSGFCWGSNVSSINLSGLDFSKCTTFEYAFRYVKNCVIDLQGCIFAPIISTCRCCFQSVGYGELTILGIENMGINCIENMNNMFSASPLTSLDISLWNFSNTTDMSEMFSTSTSIKTLKIPKTNGNGLANTPTRLYGEDESTYFDLSTLSGVTIIIAS